MEKKPKKVKAPKPPKEKPTEAELVHRAARNIIHRQITRGHGERMIGETSTTTNKDLWMDTEFFVSVVFQSKKQKYEFFDKLAKKLGAQLVESSDDGFNIINGLVLAERLGITLTEEKCKEFPHGDLALRKFVLDDEVTP